MVRVVRRMTNSSTTPGREAPQVEQGGQNEEKHTEELERVPQLEARLGEIRHGDKGHVQHHLGHEQAGGDRELAEQQRPHHPERVVERAGGVEEASFTPSIMISMTSNCMIMGTVFGSLIRTNSSQGGIISGFCMSRYQMGLKTG